MTDIDLDIVGLFEATKVKKDSPFTDEQERHIRDIAYEMVIFMDRNRRSD